MNTSSDTGREIPAFAGMTWGLGMFWLPWRPRSPCTLRLPLICPSKGYAKVSEGGNLALRTRHANAQEYPTRNTSNRTHRGWAIDAVILVCYSADADDIGGG